MRLKKENQILKNETQKYIKNKKLIEGNQNIKSKFENDILINRMKRLNTNQNKENIKEKNLKESKTSNYIQNNSNIYKPNRKLQIKQNTQIKASFEKISNNTINENKSITMNTNNNINIGNNINIITNNHINSSNNIIKNKIMNHSQLISDYNDNSIKSNYPLNYNRLNFEFGNLNKNIKEKNSSMEQRHRRIIKDSFTDNNILNEQEKKDISKNHIYQNILKCNSPNSNYNDSYKYQTYIDLNQGILNENTNANTNTNTNNNIIYIKENSSRNKDEELRLFSNNNYNKINGFNRKMNTIINPRELQNKTSINFYIHKSPITSNKKINRNINNSFFNYFNNRNNSLRKSPESKGHINSMIMDGNYQMSPFGKYNESNNINNKNSIKSSRRSKNKIRITKINNPDIIEYNLDIQDENDDSGEYQTEFNLNNNFNNSKRFNEYKYNSNIKSQKDLQRYYSFFTKNIKPISINHFNIYSSYSKITDSNNNYLTSSNSNTKNNNITNYETNSNNNNNLISTPNFSETGKTPKRPNVLFCQKLKPFNKDFNENSNIISKTINLNFEEENSTNKILVKKRPKNEIPTTSLSNKRIIPKNNLKNNNNRIFEICTNEILSFNPNKKIQREDNNENKLCFKNENEVIDYINKKYEEEKKKKGYYNKKLRFTGFVLSKKYKGKNLYDIRIEDDINKINHQFKDEQVLVNNKIVELKYFDDNSIEEKSSNFNTDDKNELDEENKNLKLENEKLNKKDLVNSDLINKLDKEKQNLIKEVEKLTNIIDELKIINNKLIEEKNKYIQEKENNLNKNILYEIENSSLFIIDNLKENSTNENSYLKINEKNKLINNDNNKLNLLGNENIINDYINKNSHRDKKDENKNQINKLLNNNYILSNIINSENIKEKISDINKENYCNNIGNINNNSNIYKLNNNENSNMGRIDINEVMKIDKVINNINLEESKDIISNVITDNSNIDIDINNQSHPRINDLADSEISEKDEFSKNY